jgi:hypothetical protein
MGEDERKLRDPKRINRVCEIDPWVVAAAVARGIL